jgi:hypothetical protein
MIMCEAKKLRVSQKRKRRGRPEWRCFRSGYAGGGLGEETVEGPILFIKCSPDRVKRKSSNGC